MLLEKAKVLDRLLNLLLRHLIQIIASNLFTCKGSTWAQEMVWLLGNNLDYEGAKNIQTLRSPLLEMTAILYEDYTEWVT